MPEGIRGGRRPSEQESIVHILTKIFAVIAAVLALLFAALATTYSMNADRIVTENRELGARLDSNGASLRTQASERSERITSLEKDIEALRNQETTLRARIAQLESEQVELNSARRVAEADAQEVTRQIGQLAQTVDTQQELIASYRGEVQELRQQELDFREREIGLVDRLNDLESQNDVLDQTVRALRVELTSARQSLAQADRPTGSTGAGAPIEIAGRVIAGEVTRVRDDAGRQLAQVDLGSSDRMVTNARLYVLRGDEFLGHLILETVEGQSSVGRFESLGANVSIRAGDRVVSSLSQRAGS